MKNKFDKKEKSILELDELFKDIGKNTGFTNGELVKKNYASLEILEYLKKLENEK